MPNITLSVSEEVRRHMDEHPEVRWSNAIRAIIEKKLNDFDIAESLAQKSRLTEEDVALLSGKANKAMGKRAKRLLDEGNS